MLTPAETVDWLSRFGIHQVIVDNMSEAVYVRDRDRGIVYINPAAEALTGWSLDEALKMPCYEVFGDPGAHCNLNCPIDKSAREHRTLRHLEGRLVCRDGSVMQMSVSISPIFADDQLIGSVVVLQDISDLRALQRANEERVQELGRAQAELLASHARFRDFAEVSSDWFWETDAYHRFTYVAGRPGHDQSHYLGKTRFDLIDTGDEAKLWADHRADLDARRAFRDFTYQIRDIDDHLIWVRISGRPYFDTDGAFCGYRGMGADVTEQVEAQQLSRYQASYDHLTQLANRRLFDEQLGQSISLAVRHGRSGCLIAIDLDGFKVVNDTLGHQSGDELLIQVADRLRQCVRSSDTVARTGGDEFVVLMPVISAQADATVVAEKIRDRLADAFVIDGKSVTIGGSLGIAIFPDHGDKAEDVAALADAAMYISKHRGKNRVTVFRPGLELVD